MHQASWPAASVDPRQPDVKVSVAQVRRAYDDLFACLDLLERKLACPRSGRRSEGLTPVAWIPGWALTIIHRRSADDR
jgi:hypothetical protein